MKWGISQSCHCSHDYQYYPFLIPLSQEQNPQRVSEAVHERSARINVIVPGHPDSLPGGGRITPIIYVGGGQAEHRGSKEVVSGGNGNALVLRNGERYAATTPLTRVTNKYYRNGHNPGHRFSRSSPLREIARFVQGIVLFKESTLYQGFSCN